MFLFIDGIVKYMRSKAGPASRDLKTVAEVERFISNDEHSIVGMTFAVQYSLVSFNTGIS